MPEQTLTRINKLEVDYPPRALQDNVEGWVELAYTVGRQRHGHQRQRYLSAHAAANISSPRRRKAVSRLRYQPVIQGGKAISVGTRCESFFVVPK